MKNAMGEQVKAAFIIWLVLIVCIPAACSPGPAAPADTSPPATTATLFCEQTLLLPQVTEIRPAQPRPGDEITVIAYGGSIQDGCGGYIEGAREFILHLDDEPVGSVTCYINHCEGKFILSETAVSGAHCLATEDPSVAAPNTCPFEFQVVQQ
jgi:hypothetical protein